MTTFKDVLCLLAIFVAYGIVGRLDYEDAVRLEQTQRERLHADCLTATPADREALARMLGRFSGELAELTAAVEGGDGERLLEIFARAKRARDRYVDGGVPSPE